MSAPEPLKHYSVCALSVVSGEKWALVKLTIWFRKSVLSNGADQDFLGMTVVEIWNYNLHVSSLLLCHERQHLWGFHHSRGEARKGEWYQHPGSVICSERPTISTRVLRNLNIVMPDHTVVITLPMPLTWLPSLESWFCMMFIHCPSPGRSNKLWLLILHCALAAPWRAVRGTLWAS